ncbi:MAG: prenyltransferase/squalene oxidase repeat-containing protein [Planctomycetota bacterium]
MTVRRSFAVPAVALLTLCAAGAHAQAGAQPGAANAALPDEITPELDDAIARGLGALADAQADNGSFGEGRYANNVAVTAIACIAFMADGSVPGRGPYGEQVRRGLEFILDNATDSGLIAGEAANGPMYGHGFATLFLGEVYGMTAGDQDLSDRTYEALVKAVRLIEQTQNDEGGWRYNPRPYDADVSVTICQVMALRSARNAGIEVSKDVIDKAVEYVLLCQNPDGGFRYQTRTRDSAWPRTAAGVSTLYYAGLYGDDRAEDGLVYLALTAAPGGNARRSPHYFYGQYYAVQAMYLAGGEWWASWWPAVREELLSMQNQAGMWDDRGVGPSYGTGMALIVLQMPKRYLPIFQK